MIFSVIIIRSNNTRREKMVEALKTAGDPADISCRMSRSLITCNDQLISVVYVSSAAYLFSEADVTSILKQSRDNNERDGLTGMLLYRDGNLLQALEGPEAAIRATMKRIGRDPRHKGILILRTKPIEQRDFAEWQMGFHEIGSEAFKGVPGYSPFMNSSFASEEFQKQPTFAYKMLLQFKEKFR